MAVPRRTRLDDSETTLSPEASGSYVVETTLSQLQALRKANKAKLQASLLRLNGDKSPEVLTNKIDSHKRTVSELKESTGQYDRMDAELALEMKTLRIKQELSESKTLHKELLSRNAQLMESISLLQKVESHSTRVDRRRPSKPAEPAQETPTGKGGQL